MTRSEPASGGGRSADRVAEDERDQLTRRVGELLQELRVVLAGVQILFAFLLSVVFTNVYQSASGYLRGLHLVTVLLAAGSALALTAPAAWHRVLLPYHRRVDVVRMGNRSSLVGLVLLGAAMTGSVLLISEVAVGGWPAKLIGGMTAVAFGGVWFIVPLARRRR